MSAPILDETEKMRVLNRLELAVWKARRWMAPEVAAEYRRLLDRLGYAWNLLYTASSVNPNAPRFWSVNSGEPVRPVARTRHFERLREVANGQTV